MSNEFETNTSEDTMRMLIYLDESGDLGWNFTRPFASLVTWILSLIGEVREPMQNGIWVNTSHK